MPLSYAHTEIILGSKPQHFGHVVYTHAQYQHLRDDPIPIIYKESKKAHSELMQYEAAFGELARLFLGPHLTPPQTLVKDLNHQVVGLACEHVSYTIAKRHGLPTIFYELNHDGIRHQFRRRESRSTENIPYYFLREFPNGFFNTLRSAQKNGKITIDMPSIADILTTSYALEEDDLHKGNFGFYVVQENGKPHVIFFKIDHDLMLSDSIMSRCHTRWMNFFHGPRAFDVTPRDLLNFPHLDDSQNYYWPTVKHPVLGLGAKAYKADAEVRAFDQLGQSRDFRAFKWKAFYKQVLIPPELIVRALSKHLDDKAPSDRAKIALITQAVVARQAKLRAVLFSIPQFQCFVNLIEQAEQQAIIETILLQGGASEDLTLKAKLAVTMQRYQALCQPGGGFEVDDTPLHVAIRLQDYRFEDTVESFGSFIHQTNMKGETPLDVAVKMAGVSPEARDDIRADALSCMSHLLEQGATKTTAYQQWQAQSLIPLSQYRFDTGYPLRAKSLKSIDELIVLLRDLGEDHRYALKMQKNIAVMCVRDFIHQHKSNPSLGKMLSTLKSALNGKGDELPIPQLQYIRQLRSRYWFVRMYRGLLGGTTTQVRLNHLIDDALKSIQPSISVCSIFSRSSPASGREKKEMPDRDADGLVDDPSSSPIKARC